MQGFKDFVLKGNLVELAVAFIIAGAFAKVVEALVTVIMDLVGKLGDTPDFSNWKPGGVSLGAFITVLISFLILAAVVYFLVVKPYQAARERMGLIDPEDGPSEVDLLTEIRDSLRARN